MKVWTDSESQERWLNAITNNTSERQQMINKTFIVTLYRHSGHHHPTVHQSVTLTMKTWAAAERAMIVKEGKKIFKRKNEKVLRIKWFQVTGVLYKGEGPEARVSILLALAPPFTACDRSTILNQSFFFSCHSQRDLRQATITALNLIRSAMKRSGHISLQKINIYIHSDSDQ